MIMNFYRFVSGLMPQSIKNQYHLLQAMLACAFFGLPAYAKASAGKPAQKLKIIGVTGTNGKTTTVQFIARILERAGYKVAVASTINFQIGERKWVNASKFTTLSSWKLQKFLYSAVCEGCEYAVIETSSHALDQNRVWGVPYSIVVITNVTREHLDYHKTMAEYRSSKRKLFLSVKQAVINLDMESPEYFHTNSQQTVLFYSVKNSKADLYADKIEERNASTDFALDGARFHLNTPGLFNVENALAALGVARLLNIDFSVAKEALANIEGVPGRMERVPNERGLNIIIDYAVTPDAFEKLYNSILPLKISGAKIIHVFGACGERDRGKRPMMGEISSKYADIIILTNEDPYYENPEQIIDDIEKGVVKKNDGYFRIFDRREAIRKAIALATSCDIILVTGKGVEVTMAIGDKRLPWSERKVIEEELKKINE
jgi:UDP-N-acetylmuramoyl-L-alanyl-D-glutamate--2,6-diaminopimelate ligase